MATKKKEETTELATVNEASVPAAFDYGSDIGAGYENQTSADQMVPFIEVLQGLSPACQGEDAKGRPGMLRNTATNDLYSGRTGVLFVPATTDHVWVEWRPRDAGGGLVGRHACDSDEVKAALARPRNEKGKVINAAGNEMVETFYLYGVLCEEDGTPTSPAVLSCYSTKIKPYRQLMTRLRTFQIPVQGRKVCPPLFANLLRLTTREEKRTAGASYNLVFEAANDNNLAASLLRPDDARFEAAKALRESVLAGTAKASTESSKTADEDDTPF